MVDEAENLANLAHMKENGGGSRRGSGFLNPEATKRSSIAMVVDGKKGNKKKGAKAQQQVNGNGLNGVGMCGIQYTLLLYAYCTSYFPVQETPLDDNLLAQIQALDPSNPDMELLMQQTAEGRDSLTIC